MATTAPPTDVARARTPAAWLPLAVLPAAAVWLGLQWPPWVFMWALAFSIYSGLKWLTVADGPAVRRAVPWTRATAYLLLWPGMDAPSFLRAGPEVRRPETSEWLSAAGKTALGLLLVFGAARPAYAWHPAAAGWVGMIGIVMTLHFGLFHLLSVSWRQAGVDAPPIMDAPILSSSLGDFWGRRWNRAFRDVAHSYIFRPLHRGAGPVAATSAVFLVSGLVHDLVISLPARGGWGLPTAYFAIQGLGVFIERSRAGKRLGLRQAGRGRLFAAAVVMLPLPLLFHPPFIQHVVGPMLSALGAIQ